MAETVRRPPPISGRAGAGGRCPGHAISIYDADLTVPLLLVIGGEKRGITRSFEDQADLRLAIPYGSAFDQSLGTAPATAVLAFEVLRQRGRGGV